ncbi:DUF3945 domain-containing protein [Spirosoma fluminis]
MEEIEVVKPDQPSQINPENNRISAFERAETQQYQIVLPTEREQLRGYLENDGLLSDEEITRCLYDETLRKTDLAKSIKERTPTATDADRQQLTDYLWEVHQSVKGLPLTFVNPTQTYRVDVIDTPVSLVTPGVMAGENPRTDMGLSGSQVSSVTLHLDINGGFLANFLHNAQLNHEQMNRFITDLERQHRELKAHLSTVDLNPVLSEPPTPGTHVSYKPESVLPDLSRPDSSSVTTTEIQPKRDAPPQLTPHQPENHTQPITMSETNIDNAEATASGRATRYQWAEVAAQFDKVGISRQDLEKAGHLDDLLNGRKTGLMKLTQQGDEGRPFQISGKLYIVNTPDKGPIIGIQPERKQLLVPNEFLGYTLTNRDKQNLEKNGEMGKRVELTDKMTGKSFASYIGVDKETKSLTVLRAERLHIPQTVKGVTLTKQQQKSLEQGRAVKLDGMTGNNGQTFNAYVQVSAAKRSLTFAKIPDNAIKQTVDQKTAQDLNRPVQQLKGDGDGGKKTIQPKDETRQAAAQRVDAPTPPKQQKSAAPKPADETKPAKSKKQKGPRVA